MSDKISTPDLGADSVKQLIEKRRDALWSARVLPRGSARRQVLQVAASLRVQCNAEFARLNHAKGHR